jgi:hypothetical protein
VFTRIRNDNHARGSVGDDFLAQQRAATSLDQREARADLVGSIDIKIKARGLLEARHGNAKTPGQLVGRFGGRDACHRQAVRDALSKEFDEVRRCRPGAKAEPHATLHIIEGRGRGLSLELVRHRVAMVLKGAAL